MVALAGNPYFLSTLHAQITPMPAKRMAAGTIQDGSPTHQAANAAQNPAITAPGKIK
jgi:hypothetical protein